MKAKMMTLAAGLAALLLTALLLAALLLTCCGQATATDCSKWNTAGFFKKASVEDVRTCLDAGANLNARTTGSNRQLIFGWSDDSGSTPLHLAARNSENPAVIETLIDAGADPNARDTWGSTPLHRAARDSENPAVIQALLDGGADLEARDTWSLTPLHLAADNKINPAVIQALVIQALLDAGANIEARDEDGNTPLHKAARRSRNPAVIQALLNAGADASAQNDWGEFPVDLIGEVSPLRGTDFYRKLHDARYK